MEIYGNTQSDPNLSSKPLTADAPPEENEEEFVVKLPDENYAGYVGRAGAAGVEPIEEHAWQKLPAEGEPDDDDR